MTKTCNKLIKFSELFTCELFTSKFFTRKLFTNKFKILALILIFGAINQIAANGEIEEIFGKKLEKEVEGYTLSRDKKLLLVHYKQYKEKDSTSELFGMATKASIRKFKNILRSTLNRDYNTANQSFCCDFYDNLFVVRYKDGSLELINTEELINTKPENTMNIAKLDKVRKYAIYDNLKKMFVEYSDDSIEIIDVGIKNRINYLLAPVKFENVKSLDFLDNYRLILFKYHDNSIEIVNATTGKGIVNTNANAEVGKIQGVETVDFEPKSKLLFVRFKDSAKLINTETGVTIIFLTNRVKNYYIYNDGEFLAVEYEDDSNSSNSSKSQDGDNLKTQGNSKTLFNIKNSNKKLGEFNNVRNFVFWNKCNRIFVIYNDDSIQLINKEDGEKIGNKIENVYKESYYYPDQYSYKLENDEKILSVRHQNNLMEIIDTESGKRIAEYNRYNKYNDYCQHSFYNNFKLLLIPHSNSKYELINATTGNKIRCLNNVSHLAFFDRLLLVKYEDNTFELIDTETNQIIRGQFDNINPNFSYYAFNDRVAEIKDHRPLLIRYKDGSAELFDSQTGQVISKYDNYKSHALLADNKLLLIEYNDVEKTELNLETSKRIIKDPAIELVNFGTDTSITKLSDVKSYASNKGKLFIEYNDGSVQIIELLKQGTSQSLVQNSNKSERYPTINNDGIMFVKYTSMSYYPTTNKDSIVFVKYTDEENTAILMNIRTNSRIAKFSNVEGFSFEDDNKFLLIKHKDGSVKLVETETGKIIYESNDYYSHSFDKKDRLFFIEHKNGSKELINIANKSQNINLNDMHTYSVYDRGKLLVTEEHKDDSIELINMENGNRSGKLSNIHGSSFNGDCSRLFIQYKDYSGQLFDTASCQAVGNKVKNISSYSSFFGNDKSYIFYKDKLLVYCEDKSLIFFNAIYGNQILKLDCVIRQYNIQKNFIITYEDDSIELINKENCKRSGKLNNTCPFYDHQNFYDNDQLLYVYYKNGSVEIFNTETCEKINRKFCNTQDTWYRPYIHRDCEKILVLTQTKKQFLQEYVKKMAVLVAAKSMKCTVFEDYKGLNQYKNKSLKVEKEDGSSDFFDIEKHEYFAKNCKYSGYVDDLVLTQDKEKDFKIFKIKE